MSAAASWSPRSWPLPLRAQSPAPFPIPVETVTLENGLTRLPDQGGRAGPVALPGDCAHRQPRRGRGRQERLRALLRAHDVPRHGEVSGLRRRDDEDGRVSQRHHERRPDALSPRGEHGLPGEDHGPRGGPLPEPAVPGSRLQDRGRRRPRRAAAGRARAAAHARREGARDRVPASSLWPHDHRLRGRRPRDAARLRLQPDVLSPVLPARERRRRGRRRLRQRRGHGAVRKYYGGWRARLPAAGHSSRAAADRAARARP